MNNNHLFSKLNVSILLNLFKSFFMIAALSILVVGINSLSFSSKAWSQTATVKDIDVKEGEAISIEKGPVNKSKGFDIESGEAEITGDPSVLEKGARENWKKACESWKKEIKELNTDNQVIAISCNSPVCSRKSSNETSCDSKGTYKLKIKHIK
jgi:LPS O-antigen subunit length determinant protein (WzzB/FepE family)